MKLQKILWNDSGEYGSKEIFYRSALAYEDAEHTLFIPAGESLSFDTYFNMFSLCKWRKHTKVSAISAKLTLSGSGTAEVIGFKIDKNPIPDIKDSDAENRRGEDILGKGYAFDVEERVICSTDYDFENPKSICVLDELPVNEEYDFLYMRISTNSDTHVFGGGFYGTALEKRDIRIACCICTYKREDDLRRNVGKILSELIENPESGMDDRLEVYISDNGQTLKPDCFGNEKIHIFKNRNYGGSSGFTRCMIEAVLHNAENAPDYLILMDDDINLYPEVVIRTWNFLGVLKDEYRRSLVGGLYMYKQEPDIQNVPSEYINLGNGIITWNMRLVQMDMTSRNCVISNEMLSGTNYNGWWYCCVPTSIVTKDNLPHPLFIHGDDVEYGVRTGKPVIQLNGICVWHPHLKTAFAAYSLYYGVADGRNCMINAAIDRPEEFTLRTAIRMMLLPTVHYCFSYQYIQAKTLLLGYEHFYNGVDAFKKLKPDELHKSLMTNAKLRTFDIPDDVHVLMEDPDLMHITRHPFRYLLPAKGICYLDSNADTIKVLKYKKIILCEDGKGAEFVKSWRETFNVLWRLFRICCRAMRTHEKVVAEWAAAGPELKSQEFWETYLGIEP